MILNQIATKIAKPYAQALFNFSIEKNIMYQITFDFQNLKTFFKRTTNLQIYLNNPLINQKSKTKLLTQLLKSKLNSETFKFLLILVKRGRINVLTFIISYYLKLVYMKVLVKPIYVLTAYKFNDVQKFLLNEKLKKLTYANEILLIIKVNPNLIGGFLIKTESKILNFTIKDRLKKISKHLNYGLNI